MSKSEKVEFRIPALLYDQLLEWAHDENTSANLVARRIVVEGMRRERLSEDLDSLHQQIAELRKDLAVATRALLVKAGQVKEADALAWVKQNLS